MLQVFFPSSCEVPPEAVSLAKSLFLSNFESGDDGILGERGRCCFSRSFLLKGRLFPTSRFTEHLGCLIELETSYAV